MRAGAIRLFSFTYYISILEYANMLAPILRPKKPYVKEKYEACVNLPHISLLAYANMLAPILAQFFAIVKLFLVRV